MNKTPISVALERQIPEYVRGEYELFVNFIKAYYEFLNETQQRNLEDVRSIENTLDEFVIRFKKELSVLFPTNTLANERFILQRIREFYQARGSKESYQFLFRILFNKDSDVFYPSTQILRASDGKWIQEKSVFVKVQSGNLFNLDGKIISITTSNKKIHVFCPRVVYYRDDIYEVFIDRAYVQDISISDIVSSEDGTVSGIILPCPNKYTITTPGAGFEVGQLYFLKTQSGDGSLVKITKIGTNGSIKKVQVISFGLDYDSIYYAKLSNKQAVAVPYRHPIPGPYPDGINGFVDYGYINRQDYFYFDKNYTPSVANNQNVFYADGTYVGEIIGSFYTNASNTNVIDADTAEIKIELGAVAIYPGYYSTSDGFVSDESYIQDGKYYQLFSYVIRVEQQIESYQDIVKELLHPAGMQMYAEYNIKNEYVVSASPLLAFIRRQFLEQEYVTDDEAANSVYKNVDAADAIAIGYHSYLEDIKNVTQPKSDSLAPIAENSYFDDKLISSTDSTSSTSDSRYNDTFKSSADLTNTPTDSITNKDVTALKQDYPVADSEVGGRAWNISSITGGTFYQTTSTTDSTIKDIGQVSADLTNTPTDSISNKDVGQVSSDTQSIDSEVGGKSWSISSVAGGTFYQTTSTADDTSKAPAKVNSDLINTPTDSISNKDVSEVQQDIQSSTDQFDRSVQYDRSQVPLVSLDPASSTDALSSSTSSAKSDSAGVVGGEWAWDGVQYVLTNPEIRIGVGYLRAPDLTLTGSVTAGTNIVNLTAGSTNGLNNGRTLVKVSGTGAFGSGTITVVTVIDSTSFTMNANASVTGTITFTAVGETSSLAQTSTASDSFPDGSIAGVVKFALSGATWNKTVPALDSFNSVVTYVRTNNEAQTVLDSFPNGSIAGVVKFALSGATWSDTLNSSIDSTPVRSWDKLHQESINTNNTGTMYVNAYNQDTSDPTSSYSYEAETYSEHNTRALS